VRASGEFPSRGRQAEAERVSERARTALAERQCIADTYRPVIPAAASLGPLFRFESAFEVLCSCLGPIALLNGFMKVNKGERSQASSRVRARWLQAK
jgi:hypothetical protein